MKNSKQNAACEIHGTQRKTANKTLLFMIFASVMIVIWHVWFYGPTNQAAKSELSQKSFPMLLGSEIWDLLFNHRGLVAELWDVFPYFIVGILLAGYMRTYKIAAKLQASLRRYGFLSIFLASLVGILIPLCACGTLTTAVSLLFAGLPLAPVIALLVTSPLLSPSTYLLTLSDLGPEWTVIRTIAAFSMGMFAGVVTHMFRNKGFQTDTIFIEGAIPRGDFHDEAYPDERLRCNCKEKFGNRVAARTNNMFAVFLAKSSEMLWLVGKYVLVGVSVGTIVERYMPREWIYKLFGQKDALSIVWITFGSVPIFLHQISASSILYHIKSALNGTLDGGAGLAFMIGGPVTAMPTMVMFWTIFKKRVFFLYMFVCIVGTIIIAYAFQWLVFVPYVDTGNPLLKGIGSISGGGAAVIHKHDKNVRIVMDPGGRSVIATYQNYMDGKGNIVFDSGLERFRNVLSDKCDNRAYIKNIAGWLEENNPANGRNILIYDTSDKVGVDKGIFSKEALDMLKEEGFKVKITGRRETPEVSKQLINRYSQFWIFVEAGSENAFSDAELETLSGFVNEGKGMLIVAGGRQDTVMKDWTAANQISSRFGVTFSGFVENKKELPVATAPYFFSRGAETLGKVLKFVQKA